MRSVNKAILVGNLGTDPEVRHTQSGQAVASFSLATNEQWGGRDGQERQERTEWHRVVAWGRLAEICGEYLKKGRQVYLEGRIQTRQWQDQQGNKRYTTEIVAQQMMMLGGRGEGAPMGAPMAAGASSSGPPTGGGGGGGGGGGRDSQSVASPPPADAPDSGGDFFDDDDDLPF